MLDKMALKIEAKPPHFFIVSTKNTKFNSSQETNKFNVSKEEKKNLQKKSKLT